MQCGIFAFYFVCMLILGGNNFSILLLHAYENIHFSILSKLTVLICVIISEPLEDAVDPPVAMETEPSAPASQAGAAYSK